MAPSPPSEDYIISLLKRDAAATASKNPYTTLGPLPSRPTSARTSSSQHNKPNTRFLRNIIRDTDSHNAALKAREEAESRARLRDLRKAGEDAKGRVRKSDKGERKGRWANVLGGLGGREVGSDSARRSKRGIEDFAPSADGERKRRKRSPALETSTRQDRDLERYAPERHRHHKGEHKARNARRTSESPARSYPETQETQRPPKPKQGEGHESMSRSQTSKSGKDDAVRTHSKRARAHAPPSDSDSDPLESLLGPLPPPRSTGPRGRGAKRRRNDSSTSPSPTETDIDTHFDPQYDPSAPRQEEEVLDDGDDWTGALKALKERARQQRRRHGSDSDAESRDGDGGGWQRDRGREREKGVEDVKWAKKGEGREWDRGKIGIVFEKSL